jgi:hypothetical protein
VKLYLALNGAVHDAAITAWGIKRAVRRPPDHLVRYMAGRGQSSDPAAPSYDPDGLPLVPGVIELITAESSAAPASATPTSRGYVGKSRCAAWRGEPGDARAPRSAASAGSAPSTGSRTSGAPS